MHLVSFSGKSYPDSRFDDTCTPERHNAITSASKENPSVKYDVESMPVHTGLPARRDLIIIAHSENREGPFFFMVTSRQPNEYHEPAG
jgi:hypothetical protein